MPGPRTDEATSGAGQRCQRTPCAHAAGLPVDLVHVLHPELTGVTVQGTDRHAHERSPDPAAALVAEERSGSPAPDDEAAHHQSRLGTPRLHPDVEDPAEPLAVRVDLHAEELIHPML